MWDPSRAPLKFDMTRAIMQARDATQGTARITEHVRVLISSTYHPTMDAGLGVGDGASDESDEEQCVT